MRLPSVLIVDDDLGFLVWLPAILGKAGYGAIPARTISDAAKLMRGFRPRVLVINPSLRGAANFVNRLRRQNPDLKVIFLADPRNQLENITVAHIQSKDVRTFRCRGRPDLCERR